MQAFVGNLDFTAVEEDIEDFLKHFNLMVCL